MKIKIIAILISSILILAGNAQTTTGTNSIEGTYKDVKLTLIQRVTLANAIITGTTTDSILLKDAIYNVLLISPIIPLMQVNPTLADNIINDPTFGGKIDNSDGVLDAAYSWKEKTITNLDARISYLHTQMVAHPTFGCIYNSYIEIYSIKSTEQLKAQDYNGVISTLIPIISLNGMVNNQRLNNMIQKIFTAKLALRSADVLSWAKLLYLISDFKQSQIGINAVSSAYRGIYGNLIRANEFIKYQQDGIGTNPLESIPLPTGINNNQISKILSGDNIGQLKSAVFVYSAAENGKALDDATADVAKALRNIDGNLVRANAYVTAQTSGSNFVITELQ